MANNSRKYLNIKQERTRQLKAKEKDDKKILWEWLSITESSAIMDRNDG